MRGKVRRGLDNLNADGITPAYAGKRWQERAKTTARKDHPRLCGEKGLNTRKWTIALGSPPPMRGKAHVLATGFENNRITPAYAGKRHL